MNKLTKWFAIFGVIFFLGCYLVVKFLPADDTINGEYPTIGVIQIADHPALNQTRDGILAALKEANLVPGKTINWVFELARGNPTVAKQITQKLVSQKVKLLITIGTTPSKAAAQATVNNPDIAIVFASVTDPVGAKLLTNPKKPEGNITGVANDIDIAKQFKVFLKIMPNIKRLGVIHNPNEDHAVILLTKMRAAAKEFNLEIISVAAKKTDEVSKAVKSLVGKVDAVFINNDNTALAAFDSVALVAKENNLAVFVSDQDCLEKGALAAIGPDQYALGVKVGEMVVSFVKDKVPLANIPAVLTARPELKLNMKVANQLGIHLLNELVDSSELEAN